MAVRHTRKSMERRKQHGREQRRYRRSGLLGLVVWCLLVTLVEAAQESRSLRRIAVAEQHTAQEILAQLRQGTSFSALARAKSIGPEYRNWGYAGTVPLRDIQPELRGVLLKLKEGQISDILEMGGQFVIVKLVSPKIEQHFEAADQAERAQQLAKAIQELQAAIRLEVDNVQAYIKLGLLQQSTKQFDEAVRTLEKAAQYAPQEVQITLLIGSVYTHAATEGKNAALAEKAVQVFQKVLQQDERYTPSVNFGIGKVYLTALQQPDKALHYLEKAADATQSVAEAHRLLIQAYYDTKRYDQAWQRLRRAQELGFDFPDLLKALQKAKQHSQR